MISPYFEISLLSVLSPPLLLLLLLAGLAETIEERSSRLLHLHSVSSQSGLNP